MPRPSPCSVARRAAGTAALACAVLAGAPSGACGQRADGQRADGQQADGQRLDGRAAEPVTPALARATFDSAWRGIRDAYYDPAMRGVDWAAVRDELRPRAESARTLGELRAVLRALAARLGESHFALLPGEAPASASQAAAPEARGGVGVRLRVVDDRVVVAGVDSGGPAARSGIRTGWALLAVDGVAPAVEPAVEPPPGDTVAARRRDGRLRRALDAERRLAGAVGSLVALRLADGEGAARTVTLRRERAPGLATRYGHLGDVTARLEHRRLGTTGGGCVGVLRLDHWMPVLLPAIERAFDALRDCRGLVLDLRGNLGGVSGMAMAVASHVVPRPTVLGVLRARGVEQRFVAEPRRVTATGERAAPFAGPVAVLVDAHSASTSEFFAAALQEAGRARVFGERTAGQALPAAVLRLPTGDRLLHVVADFSTAGGRRVEGVGVEPDEPVPLRRDDLLAGRDAPLQAAVAWIARHPVRPEVTFGDTDATSARARDPFPTPSRQP